MMHFPARSLLVIGTILLAVLTVAIWKTAHDAHERHVQAARAYVGPYATGGAWTASAGRVKALVKQMTLEEKVNLTVGAYGYSCTGNTGSVPRFNISSICYQDGPSGVRAALNVTQFASQITIAATWNVDLAASHAAAMGQEFHDKGVNVMFAPISGGPLGRSALNGRASEGFGSDEFLHGAMAYHAVKGSQSSGVVATLKHWIGYEQEKDRGQRLLIPDLQSPVNSIVDDKTLHHLYMWPFAEAIRAGAGAVMCSYNQLNGTHSCENEYSLNTLLKGELNFQGSVVSDYGASWSLEDSIKHGLDVLLPGEGGKVLGVNLYPNDFGTHGDKVLAAVKANKLPESRIDDMVIRLLTPLFEYERDLTSTPRPAFNKPGIGGPSPDPVNVQRDHYQAVRQAGVESLNLLKNVNTAGRGLPLSTDNLKKLAVAGRDAIGVKSNTCLATGECITSGTVTDMFGSGYTFPPYIVDPLSAVQARLKGKSTTITNAPSARRFGLAARNAAGADAALVFVSVTLREGQDRKDFALDDNGEDLIRAVAGANDNTIVVVHSPAAINMEAWIDNANVTAVLYAYYPGQESGNGLVSVLFGDASPSGKLPFVIGKQYTDWPASTFAHSQLTLHPQTNFTERTLIDWKWFDTKQIEPRFPFGFGLSYTSFKYGDASIAPTFAADTTSTQPTKEPFKQSPSDVISEGKSIYDVLFTVSIPLTNSGTRPGAEVAQLYLSYPGGTPDVPAHVLRGFQKLSLMPGETQTAQFPIRRKDLSVWDVLTQQWTILDGTYTFFVAPHSNSWASASAVTLTV
ncbi:hypothetical protein OC845_000661 [Tilletia horrida]|nr:hypothetical protein OC845_000661 [Tilletia horrida]